MSKYEVVSTAKFSIPYTNGLQAIIEIANCGQRPIYVSDDIEFIWCVMLPVGADGKLLDERLQFRGRLSVCDENLNANWGSPDTDNPGYRERSDSIYGTNCAELKTQCFELAKKELKKLFDALSRRDDILQSSKL